ncbi:MAG: bifunctional DNA-formamidopyrimidine glycosylase/DNA-(apurinic or apyrimidinic site) lyase [Deltaproteobacteria bacterium]|nr:bifunctional DNA-formamidopyrimidine glycosylase/DNA-(apurinic or apyrimidinic site) lyase [Deltaproteobacteria bacterium]PNV85819.1 MAG: DNA-formamidopyrimidine glycosylase [Desulfobacteraceae bacterium]MDH3773161.1 bifunctional DNA-formamidopyrimidine glycosylase/DNA-(apurinic or apyrimidinic site) lyase [Deltaproteobacteria bacterium]MDH3801520.1 bifunctional DNA-formamidopyrimidine glycosylase/DNA-(apurinic or apyrimidinic site) lyase [Deltaproteobacteria bacterium]MDH3850675.1 bifunctio
MPELPEVEVIRRGLKPHLVGRTINRVVISNRRLRLPVPRAKLNLWIQSERVKSVDRRAKYLLVRMHSGAVMVLHLGMTGRLAFFANGTPRAAHDHLRFELDSGLELRFNDVRRFGSVQVLGPEDVEGTRIFADLGPEPLGPDLSSDYLLERARSKVRPIKNFLMDARVVVGIGNIYANEILFAAGIKPTRGVGTLGKSAWERVIQASRQVLERAIACGGATISDYVNSSGETGYFQCELRVYGREGEVCQRCRSLISRQVLAGRATFYCPRCQR